MAYEVKFRGSSGTKIVNAGYVRFSDRFVLFEKAVMAMSNYQLVAAFPEDTVLSIEEVKE